MIVAINKLKKATTMKKNIVTSLTVTLLKPIIERDDGQNINPCVATHSRKTRVA